MNGVGLQQTGIAGLRQVVSGHPIAGTTRGSVLAPAEADQLVRTHLSDAALERGVVVERGPRLIVEVLNDGASVETHGSTGRVVAGARRVDQKGVGHTAEADRGVSALDDLDRNG